MKGGLWVVVLVVGGFMGYLIGYSLPPMIEVGMIGGGHQEEVGIQTEVSEDMQEYYDSLLKE
jgi:hypothetical protein